jgi:asparagine synthase (glutamine-hydrolysing)
VDAAVARRLVSDVPLGAFLSGGVDSSVVVAAMAAHSSKVRTFSIGFGETGYSELDDARRIASAFGTEHQEFVVKPAELEALPSLVKHYGEPFADSSALPTLFLSKLTREHVTVALSGDGGDEVFAGYQRYVAMRLAARLDSLPAGARGAAAAVVRFATPVAGSSRASLDRLKRFATGLPLPPYERYLQWAGLFDGARLDALLSHEFARTANADFARDLDMDDAFVIDPVGAAQRFDLVRYLPDDLLVKVDIASMAASLEVRCPLLDRELVEFVLPLPTSLKLRNGQRKHLLRAAYADVVPAANLAKSKRGFAVPLETWFRNGLRPFVRDVLFSDRAISRGYFRREAVEELLEEHDSRRDDHSQRIWALVMLELWHREFIDAR